MRNKGVTQTNIDNSDLFNYPDGRIRNNDGSGNGTPVDESVYGDLHENAAKIIRDSKMPYNNLPDNTSNGYQLYDALMSLGGKNDMVKSITVLNPTTLLIPVFIEALKLDESIIFKADFDSTIQMNLIRGSDNISKQLIISGSFKSGQKVRMINSQNSISLVGLYDSEVLPNLIQNISDINNTFNNLTKILSVFVAGGTMLFWNKPANQIPNGWREVENWRGRFPVGFDISQPEFNVLGDLGVGGVKSVTLTAAQIPSVGISINAGRERVGTGNQNGVSANGGGGATLNGSTGGGGGPHTNLPPYKTVLFIEYIG